jgi:hypothetical protein
VCNILCDRKQKKRVEEAPTGLPSTRIPTRPLTKPKEENQKLQTNE